MVIGFDQWRDVNALFDLGTTTARRAVDKTRFHNNTKVRNYALKICGKASEPFDWSLGPIYLRFGKASSMLLVCSRRDQHNKQGFVCVPGHLYLRLVKARGHL